MRRRALLVSAAALGLAGCVSRSPEPPALDRDEFERRVRETTGVVSLDTATKPWKVEVDTTLPVAQLQQLGIDLHRLVEEARTPLLVVHGVREASIQSSPSDPGLPPAPVPHLGWLRWLDGRSGMASAEVSGERAEVQLTAPETAVAWVRSFLDEVDMDDPHVSLSVTTDSVRLDVTPGVAEVSQNFQRIAGALDTSPGTLKELSLRQRQSKTRVGVASRDDAVAVVRALDEQALFNPDQVQLTIEAPGGLVWRGTLPELTRLLLTGDEIAQALEAAGATVVALQDDSMRVVVPNAEVGAAVVKLITGPSWKHGDDFDVELGLPDRSSPSSLPVAQWRELGPLWADALASDLTTIRLMDKPGGRRKAAFEVSFMQSRGGLDLTSPEGNQRIIDVFRRHPFEGEAQVALSFEGHLIFWSTSKGRAQDPYNALHGAPQKEPHGWQLDFLRRWDESATE